MNTAMRLSSLIPVLFLLTIFPHPAKAAIYDVSNFEQFQTALSMSEKNGESDTINVASTTIDVTSTLSFLIYDSEKQFSLTINGGGPDATILDAQNRDLTILNITYDTAVWPLDDSNVKVTVNGVSFRNTDHDNYYGGLVIYLHLAEIEVRNCSFINNTTYSYGAGVYLDTGGRATLADCTINGNSSAGDYGGGAYIAADHTEVTDCTFTNNSLLGYGDGAGLYVYTSTATITGSTFTGNTLQNYYDYGGAGIGVSADSTVVIEGNVIMNNTITENGDGGGVFVQTSGDAIIADNDISQNHPGSDGYGGGLYLNALNAEISSNSINNNSAGYGGGGFYLYHWGTALIYNNVITDNSTGFTGAGNGGGLLLYGETNILTNNTIAGNSSEGSGGGLSYTTDNDNGVLALRNNITWDNSAGLDGNDLYINADFDDNGTGALINVYNNDYPAQGGLYIIGAASSSFYNANIHTDPLFVDDAAGDFHLSSSSPCRDEGNNSFVSQILTDFEGDERIVNSTVDIGADEFISRIISGDINNDGSVSLKDAILVLQLLAGQNNLGIIQKEAGVNNYRIDLPDAIFILGTVLQGP